ncbi:MAG: DUF4124 domain-containing protein [Rhodanobacteraceae bacterium]
METTTDLHGAVALKPSRRAWLAYAIAAALLWAWMGATHAASIYKCVDAQGHLAYQDTPCAARARQHELDVQPLPTISDPSEVAASERALSRYARASSRKSRTGRDGRPSSRAARGKTQMSWECRAADGEVFYRHARCPGSVAGDGTVRSGYAEKLSSSRTRSRQGAWSRVPVHGKKITRAEACRRIHSAGAAVRDGHLRDETVSTYDHLMGRDPCSAR